MACFAGVRKRHELDVRVILGTAGHIDHGKTALVRALTGVDTDRLPEEKKRGITIELGFAPLALDGIGTVGVIDVPGHEAFVRTMVAGASGIDLALVVIAADEGVMPQTREHLAIIELLGIRRGVVAITKADLVDDEWLALVVEDARTATERALPDAPIVATSTTSGRGIDELRLALATAGRAATERETRDLFRLPIDRAFTIKGTGTVVTGTVWSGAIARDETARILPGDRSARVRGIQNHGAQVESAGPGARTAIALVGVDVTDVPRGSTLVTDRDWHETKLARADVTLLPGSEAQIRPRTWFRFHVGTSEVGARVVARDANTDKPFAARIVLDEPVVLRAGDRFVLRSSAPLNTIGGGVIVDPYAPRRARMWPVSLSAGERLLQLIDEAGARALDAASLPVRLGVSQAECMRLVGDLADEIAVVNAQLVSRRVLESIEAELATLVDRYHAEHPLELGIPAPLLRSQIAGAPELVESVLARQISDQTLAGSSGAVSRKGWAPKLDDRALSLSQTIVSQLVTAAAEPPTVEELSAQHGSDVGTIMRFLERSGNVVQVEAGRYYATDQLKSLVERLRLAMAGGKEASPSEIRDALGLSRKFLIPFLEYCDRVGYTNRNANGRVWRGT